MQSSIDVLIPVFNAARTVREAVESIRAQTLEDISIHIIDDGSTDGSAGILSDLAARDPRIRVHRKPNGGIVDALNFGLKFCTAPYVARHDADDIAYPDRLRIQKAYLDSHPGCVAVGSAVRHIDGDGKCVTDYVPLPPPSNADPHSYPAREPYIVHPFLMARRDAVRQAGGYRHACNCEDTDLYWRLQHIGTLHNLDECLGEYRLHDTSISGSSLKNGRLMAVFSQVAAISEQRRRGRQKDIQLSRELFEAARRCNALAELVELCAETLKLSETERSYLSLSASAKLLELTSYRPYDIELNDSRYIRDAFLGRGADLDRDSRSSIAAQLTGTAANLVLKRRFPAGLALLSPEFYAPFTWKLGLRLILPAELRRKLRMRMLAISSPER